MPRQTELVGPSGNDRAARRLPPVGFFLEIIKESGGRPYYGGALRHKVIPVAPDVGSANSRP